VSPVSFNKEPDYDGIGCLIICLAIAFAIACVGIAEIVRAFIQ
jgi:hypothetical protein